MWVEADASCQDSGVLRATDSVCVWKRRFLELNFEPFWAAILGKSRTGLESTMSTLRTLLRITAKLRNPKP